MRVDASEVQALAVDMATAGARATGRAAQVMDDAGERAATVARRLVRGQIRGVYLPHYAAAITHEVIGSGASVDVEFGPESDKPQGGMGPGVEYGSVNAPPHAHLNPAADEVVPALARELADLAAQEAL